MSGFYVDVPWTIDLLSILCFLHMGVSFHLIKESVDSLELLFYSFMGMDFVFCLLFMFYDSSSFAPTISLFFSELPRNLLTTFFFILANSVLFLTIYKHRKFDEFMKVQGTV